MKYDKLIYEYVSSIRNERTPKGDGNNNLYQDLHLY